MSLRVTGTTTLALLVLLALAPAALAQTGDEPAGGAELAEVIIATAGAVVATAVLFALGIGHRTGRVQVLERLSNHAARMSGLKPWAALPTELASLSLLCALFGMYWDISLHIDNGRDAGPLANPAHYFILVGLFGIFAAGFLACVLPREKPTRSAVKIAPGWYAPVGGVVLLLTAGFALSGFPLDDLWHRLFGQDVTLWGPTHLMLIGGAGISLLGNMALLVEGRLPTREREASLLERNAVTRFLVRTRYAAMVGGLLIGLSTFQAEFDFGVPQFRMLFQPVLIAVAAACALVVARLYAGRGGALVAVVWFWAIRGLVSVLVGPVLGETTPHLPLYFAEAALVELAAVAVSVKRPYRFGALAGLLVGTIGTAAEWGWSHVWMPIPWSSGLLDAAILTVPVAAVAAGVIGGFIGTTLGSPRRGLDMPVPSLAPVVASAVAIMAVVGFGLQTEPAQNVTAEVRLTETRGEPRREAHAEVTVRPASAAEDAEWVTITAWQGGEPFIVDRLEQIGPGRFRTTEPTPLHGSWKSILRLHKDDSVAGVPIFLPEDRGIPAEEVPAPPSFSREFVADHEILQREQKDDVSGALPPIAYGVVLAIALSLLALLAWALRRIIARHGTVDATERAAA